MKTTITCPECGNEHQLYYHIDTKGRKSLCYTCDRVQRYNVNGTMFDKHGGQPVVMVTGTKRRMVDEFVDGLPIPEEWSRGWKQKQQAKSELQLHLMTRRNK